MKTRVTSLRSHLLLLTLGTLLPLAALGVVGTILISDWEEAVFQDGAMERTRALMTAVDTELNGHIASLKVLAESTNLRVLDLPLFYNEITRTVISQEQWYRVDLADLTGQRLLDSHYPLGRPLPRVVDQASFDRIVRQGAPVISNLFIDDGEYHFALRVPVVRDGQLLYVLSAIIKPSAILSLLTPQRLPHSWVGVVLDANRRIVTRTIHLDEYFGHLASESLRNNLDQASEGWFRGQTLEGTEVYTPYIKSASSGWTVAFGIPAEVVSKGARLALGGSCLAC